MKRSWVVGTMVSVVTAFALVWVLTATGAVTWQVPFHGGMTQYSLLFASDTAHLQQVGVGTSGQLLSTQGSGGAPTWVNGALGVGSGYKIARGTITLDGSNPSSASHGLTTAVSCTLTNSRTGAPGLDPVTITGGASGPDVNAYAWKFTQTSDATLIASTQATDVINWICVGT